MNSPRMLKIAAIYRPEFINKFGENTIVNRGGNVFITADSEEAIGWLLDDPAV